MDAPPPYYDNPPPYNPNFSAFSPPASVPSPQSQDVPNSYSLPPGSHHVAGRPQYFYRCFSPPSLVKIFQGATVFMTFLIVACVVSTLVWENDSVEYTSYMGGFMSQHFSSSTTMPKFVKAAMISGAAINFLVSLGFLVATWSRSRFTQGRRFYFTLFVSDIILAILQAIIDIVYVIGVNPMLQSSQNWPFNPMQLCRSTQGSYSLDSSLGAGFPGRFPTYNQSLYHYCYMDPQEVVALVVGVMVVLTLSLSAYCAYKTRSKILRHGKANIYWVKPVFGQSQQQSAQALIHGAREQHPFQQAPIVMSASGMPVLSAPNSVISYSSGSAQIHSAGSRRSNSFYPQNDLCPRTEL